MTNAPGFLAIIALFERDFYLAGPRGLRPCDASLAGAITISNEFPTLWPQRRGRASLKATVPASALLGKRLAVHPRVTPVAAVTGVRIRAAIQRIIASAAAEAVIALAAAEAVIARFSEQAIVAVAAA